MTKALSQAKTCAKAFVHLKEKIKQNLKKSPKIKDSWEKEEKVVLKKKVKRTSFPPVWCTTGNGFGREGKIKRKRIGKTRQREDEGGNGGEKMKNEITKKVPKDGAKGQR